MPDLQRLFAYEAWANRETVASLRAAAGGPPEKARKIFAHLVGTGRLWLSRIQGTEKAVVWPDLTVDESAAGLEDLAARWSALLRDSGPGELSRGVAYTNSKGEPWTSAVADILMHVVIHSAYHRGQIATLLREAGHEPAYTDFIEAVRRGRVDPAV